MDYKQAVKRIEKGSILPVYLCYGPEKHLLQEFLAFLTERLIEPEHRDLAVSKFEMSETNVEAVIEDAETLPFLVPRKLIIARDAQFFTAAKDSSKVEHRIERLLEYMQSPADYSVIVFTVDAEKVDERKKIVKMIKESGGLVPFAALSSDELVQWVKRRAEKAGFTFEDGAVESLIVSAGTNLQALAGEIEKLCLFAGSDGEITKHSVEQLVVRSTEQNVFILIEEIVRLRMKKALDMLYDLLNRREEPIKLLLLMARQFRIILQVKELSRQGYSQQQIAGKLGLHPYAVKLAGEQGRAYTPQQLNAILARLAELDYQMKSGKIDKVLGLEMFVLSLAG